MSSIFISPAESIRFSIFKSEILENLRYWPGYWYYYFAEIVAYFICICVPPCINGLAHLSLELLSYHLLPAPNTLNFWDKNADENSRTKRTVSLSRVIIPFISAETVNWDKTTDKRYPNEDFLKHSQSWCTQPTFISTRNLLFLLYTNDKVIWLKQSTYMTMVKVGKEEDRVENAALFLLFIFWLSLFLTFPVSKQKSFAGRRNRYVDVDDSEKRQAGKQRQSLSSLLFLNLPACLERDEMGHKFKIISSLASYLWSSQQNNSKNSTRQYDCRSKLT